MNLKVNSKILGVLLSSLAIAMVISAASAVDLVSDFNNGDFGIDVASGANFSETVNIATGDINLVIFENSGDSSNDANSIIYFKDSPSDKKEVTGFLKDLERDGTKVEETDKYVVLKNNHKSHDFDIPNDIGDIFNMIGSIFSDEGFNVTSEGNSVSISSKGLEVSDANGDQLNTEETQEAQVNFVGLRDCTFAAPEDIDVTVGQEYQVDVTLTNEDVDNLSAFQGKLALPAGLEIVEGEDGKFIYSDRIPAKAEFKFQEYDGYTQFVLSSTSNQTITGYEGVIFSFKVKATEALAENAEIKLTDLRVAATTGQSVQSPDVTISVTNTSVADKAAFDQYKVDEAAAIEAMAEEGDSEASQALIADAKAAVEELTFDYALSLDENKALIDEIVTNLADALEAQRQQEAEEAAAVEAANAKVAELKEAAEALAVSEEAKAYEAENVQAAVATAEDAIAAVAPTIEAVEAVITEGKIALPLLL